MRVDISTKALDLEHELPSREEGENSQTPNTTTAEAEGRATGLRDDARNDDNNPAKLRERLARLRADFENARKRSLKEQQEFQEYGVFNTAKELLPVVDSLEQALQASSSNCSDLHAGVDLIRKQLLDVLHKIGVCPIHAIGEPFDPRIHHAVATADTDLLEDGTVVGELQCGYKFKDRLLRPAMVTVARKIPPALTL